MNEEHEITLIPVSPFSWSRVTDKGRIREENQDSFAADLDMGLFLVSDGMGGQQAGALASRIVTEVLPEMFRQDFIKRTGRSVEAMESVLRKNIVLLSQRIRLESIIETGIAGMGATLVMVLIRETRAYILNMGDSRAYCLRRDRLTQLSEEHSVVASLLLAGEITHREARDHPSRGQLTRYIGMRGKAYPYIRTMSLKESDRLLLCTDGLTGELEDKEIRRILRKHKDPKSTCQALIDAANASGGHDNITALVVDWFG